MLGSDETVSIIGASTLSDLDQPAFVAIAVLAVPDEFETSAQGQDSTETCLCSDEASARLQRLPNLDSLQTCQKYLPAESAQMLQSPGR